MVPKSLKRIKEIFNTQYMQMVYALSYYKLHAIIISTDQMCESNEKERKMNKKIQTKNKNNKTEIPK